MGALGWIALGSTFLQMMGQQEQGREQRMEGEKRKAAADFEAWQADQLAGQTMAAAQRQVLEEGRQSRLVASRALAVAAASGAGASDPTIVNLLAKAKGEGAYRAHVAIYEGEARARQLHLDAAATRVSGDDSAISGLRREEGAAIQSMGTLAKGGLSLFAKYGKNGPTSDSFFAGADLAVG